MDVIPVKPITCVGCSHLLELAKLERACKDHGVRNPEAGDMAICFSCGFPNILESSTKARFPNEEELRHIFSDKEMLNILLQVRIRLEKLQKIKRVEKVFNRHLFN